MDTSNPLFFLVDCLRSVAIVLTQYSVGGVRIWSWFIGFIVIGMVVSVFWRGARG